jgi:alpha-L-fucosidase 2
MTPRFSRLLPALTPLILLAAAIHPGWGQTAQPNPLLLWYRTPAAVWNEALPIGNGRLGAMVFGGANEGSNNGDLQDPAANVAIADHLHTRAQDEHLQLNESTLWQGERRSRMNPNAGDAVPEIRKLLFDGDDADVTRAEQLAEADMISIPKQLPSYSTLGDLYLRSADAGPIEDYRRELDLRRGVVRIRYTLGDTHFVREVFSSAVDQVIVVRWTADKPGAISFSATMDRPYDFVTGTHSANRLTLDPGPDHHGEIHFHGEVEALADGGSTTTDGRSLMVAKANAVTLLIAAATDFRGGPFSGGDPKRATEARLDAAAAKPYEVLRDTSVSDYRRFFDRVQLRLGLPADAVDPMASVPTDDRLRRAAAGADDPGLASLYFQFGRYLLISSSRPGGLPANLQGIWASGVENQWGSKYTININLEMNYWLAEVANLSELHQPLFDLIDMVRDPASGTGEVVARDYYRSDGFMAHHNTDIWGDAVPIDGYRWGVWPMGAAWLTLHAWDHYAYTGDHEFLARRAYPLLKGNVQFFLGYLVPDGQGHLVTGPSLSPENSYKLPDGSVHSLVMGPTMDIEILRALFDRFVRASRLLHQDSALRDRVFAAEAKLPPFRIGRFGQLEEWPKDYDEAEPGHRHISHIWALFPDDQISVRHTPELAQALRVTLERRLAAGGGQTGWSRAWVVNDWTRFGQGDLAYDSLEVLLRQSTYPDLLDNCPPGPVFQIDGNLGGAAGIANMLLHSSDAAGVPEIELLPALPKVWSQGEVSGLRARGGVTVRLAWSSGKATSATLTTSQSGRFELIAPPGQRIVAVMDGGVRLPLTRGRDADAVKVSAGTARSLTVLFAGREQ